MSAETRAGRNVTQSIGLDKLDAKGKKADAHEEDGDVEI